MEILESVKKEDFDLLNGKFEGNSFIEHVLAYKSIVYFPDNNSFNIYKDFFDTYPNSMYCINDFFVRGLFDKLLYEDPNMEIISEYEKIKNLYEKSYLGDLLKSEFYKQSIIDDLNYKKNRGKN
jgi:hypothetical protein